MNPKNKEYYPLKLFFKLQLICFVDNVRLAITTRRCESLPQMMSTFDSGCEFMTTIER